MDDFKDLKHQRRTAEIDELKKTQYRNSAIKRIQELGGCNYCTTCNTYHVESFHNPASALFCPDCGNSIEGKRMPDEMVFAIAQGEYPELVRTKSEYRALKSSAPERKVLRKVFLASAADFVEEVNRPTKGTNWNNISVYAIIIIPLVLIAILLITVVVAICQGAWHELFK